ncbi:hypothetical protein [uncultured Nitrosomonas sp.]|uniref:hypothetical protein n=1 Tax=uncultured Nitrosomonas sp. TaxID=156424 RepID=UPI0025CC128A|nr:hypothetical protein [uncultured Nitrosomonas sp.]
MQSSFSDLEYAAKKKQTRRDRFLVEIEAATPWTSLLNVIAPYYPVSGRRGLMCAVKNGVHRFKQQAN